MSLLPLRRIYNSPRYDVFTELQDLMKEAGLGAGLDGSSPTTSELRKSEDGSTYLFRLSVPGFTREDINVEVSKNHISVTAEIPSDRQVTENKNFPLIRGSFPDRLSHQEQIHASLDPSSVKASLKDGVLLITVNTIAKSSKAAKIVIQ